MIGRYRRELSVAAAYGLMLLVLAARGPAVLRARPASRASWSAAPGAGGGGGDDAGDPLPPDRHLDRLDLQHLRRGRRAAGAGGPADRRWSRWGRSLAGGAAGGGQRRAGRRAGPAVDRGDAGHAGDLARVAALRARGRVRPQPAAGLPVVRRRAERPASGWSWRSRWSSSRSFAWGLRNLAAGRAVYATGSDPEAARLAGIRPRRVVFARLRAMGALAGLAALLNAVRFADVDPNSGTGLELQVIAAVVVGGVAVSGGRGTLAGTLIGVALLGSIAPALVFLGTNPHLAFLAPSPSGRKPSRG